MSIRLQPYEDDETEGFGRYIHPEDPVNHPAHYQSPTGLEVFDVIEAFCPDDAHRSHAAKYLLRAGKKNGYVEDLQKCIAWCERAIEFHGGNKE